MAEGREALRIDADDDDLRGDFAAEHARPQVDDRVFERAQQAGGGEQAHEENGRERGQPAAVSSSDADHRRAGFRADDSAIIRLTKECMAFRLW